MMIVRSVRRLPGPLKWLWQSTGQKLMGSARTLLQSPLSIASPGIFLSMKFVDRRSPSEAVLALACTLGSFAPMFIRAA
jgi:hypothetical protein